MDTSGRPGLFREPRGGRFLRFGDFRLDCVEGRLQHDDQVVPLRSKSLALLRHLAENPDRLVSRAELLEAVWGGTAVSPSVVRVGLREVREALGEDPRSPRFIVTVGRQGYRFVSALDAATVRAPGFVGREAEIARLHQLFVRCRDLRRQIAFVSGEPGIGKSALVEQFTGEVRGARLGRVALGRCIELQGPREPYLPVLEILGRLCDGDDRDPIVAIVDRWAPTWLLQMPGLIGADAFETLQRRVPVPTRERMLREFADLLDVLGRDTPLVLVFEDLHWSDESTVDLLTYVAERTTPARVMVIGIYRPVETVVSGHPLRAIVRDLVGRRRAEEIAPELLTPNDVGAYLARIFAGAAIDPGLPEAMHARTEGNPLFLGAIVEYLLDRGVLALADGCWRLGPDAETLPPSLRELVARQVAALGSEERAVLAAASVAGADFDAIAVAAGTEQPLRHVDRILAQLADDGQLVRTAGTTSWPDETIGGTYQFLHSVHRDAIYERLPPAERARLHRAIGERLEAGWARDPSPVTATLAAHFERGGDLTRAIRHYRSATHAAKARLADREVVAHAERVLSLVARLPPSPERDEAEMECCLDLGTSLLAVRGYGTAGVEGLFVRARDLAIALEQPMVEIIARGGLYTSEVMGGDQRRALSLAEDLMAMAERFPLPLFLVIGHTTLGSSHYNVGHFAFARRHFEQAREAWETGFPRLQLDQKVLFLGLGAFVLGQSGDPDTAAEWHQELLEYARGLDDPINLAHAYDVIGWYYLVSGDQLTGLEWAERSLGIALEHGFPAHEALAKIAKGYALGDIELQRQGFAALQSTGHTVDLPVHRLQMAETLMRLERWEEARAEAELGVAAIEEFGEARHRAELHRVLGLCARAQGRPEDAETLFRQAAAIAREQGAGLFEQRALAELGRAQIIR